MVLGLHLGHLPNPDTIRPTMTQVFAYWRVSIEAQDVASQRCGVVLYCSDKKLFAPMSMERTGSGRRAWRVSPLGRLVQRSALGM